MHLDSIVQFRKLEPKKRYRYTWVRFDRGKHYDLIDKKARVYDIGGNLLIVPMKDEFCTSESEDQILNAVKTEIEMHIRVQNLISGNDVHLVEESQLDQEMAREYDCSEKSAEWSGRSKPPGHFNVC